MSKIVNLNQVRKSRARTEKKARAEENVTRFGRTKAQKKSEQSARDKAERHVDDHKKDP